MREINVNGAYYIKVEDYLRVVEEKGNLENNLQRVQKHLQNKVQECEEKESNWQELIKDLKEKDEVINKLLIKKEHYKDYIKCLEGEKEELRKKLNSLRECEENPLAKFRSVEDWRKENKKLEKELKEKDEEIEMMKEIVINSGVNYSNLSNLYNERQELKKQLKEMTKHKDKTFLRVLELEKQNEYYAKEYERLKDLYEPEVQYEDWCELKYWCDDVKTGVTKMYRQHMNYEEACELIGMDSDNWNEFNVVKYKKEVE